MKIEITKERKLWKYRRKKKRVKGKEKKGGK